uniref:Uncharacterized protein n=1 Tax=Pyxicephalus adspersus TaxID=30357 RepID=A0AAV2ZZ52_PYXAD|nr:TPA: hypothetical protein GDO54_013184 [Pyxicephalus adspersus]
MSRWFDYKQLLSFNTTKAFINDAFAGEIPNSFGYLNSSEVWCLAQCCLTEGKRNGSSELCKLQLELFWSSYRTSSHCQWHPKWQESKGTLTNYLMLGGLTFKSSQL